MDQLKSVLYKSLKCIFLVFISESRRKLGYIYNISTFVYTVNVFGLGRVTEKVIWWGTNSVPFFSVICPHPSLNDDLGPE